MKIGNVWALTTEVCSAFNKVRAIKTLHGACIDRNFQKDLVVIQFVFVL